MTRSITIRIDGRPPEPDRTAALVEAAARVAGLADDGNCWCRSWEHRDEHTRACLAMREAWYALAMSDGERIAVANQDNHPAWNPATPEPAPVADGTVEG